MRMLPALSGAFGDHPDAVVAGGQPMSWEQLHAAATAVADRISGATAVAVTATPTLDTIVGVVGCLIAGVPVVPIAPDAGPMDRDHVLSDSGADVVLDAVDLSARSSTSYPEPDGVAMILYTSGTTGLPKGVPVTPGAIAACLDGLADAWAWTPDDVLAHGLPLYHVHGLVLGVLGALRHGSRLVHTGRSRPAAYAEARASLYFGVPTVWSRIADDPSSARGLASARLLVSGSAGLPPTVFEQLHDLTGHRLVERYGMTETLITVSARADADRVASNVGIPLPGIQTRVTNDGELEITGPTVFSGYLNRPDATAEAFTSDGWFRTGDTATIAPDGTHRIIGRTTVDIIKTGGYRIGAGEIEQALLTHPAVREAAVIGAPHSDLGQEAVAYVVADGVSAEDLTAFVAGNLAVHKRPRRVIFVESLPRNAMGKVLKQELMLR